jgi:hypothetical protein
MFRTGGTAEGITSGLSRQGYKGTDNASDQRVSKWPTSRNFNDFLISFGLDLASRPKGGNIFQQAATSAKGPFEQFQARRAAGEDKDWRREWEQEGRDIKAGQFEEEMGLKREGLSYEKERDIADRELQEKLGVLEAQGEKEFIVQQISAYWDPLIEAATDPKEIEKLEESKRADIYDVIVLGSDISDKYKILSNSQALEIAQDNAISELESQVNPATGTNWSRGDVGYAEKLQKLINKYLALATKFLDEEKAERRKEADGGRIGYQQGNMVQPNAMQASMPMNQAAGPTDQETNQINISYEQLRERLPQEISDKIVLLLSESYEAFADFAEIQTQADVNEFNTKYNVQLFLPKQAEA